MQSKFKLSLLEVEKKKAPPRPESSLLFRGLIQNFRRASAPLSYGSAVGVSSDTKIALIARAFPQNKCFDTGIKVGIQ